MLRTLQRCRSRVKRMQRRDVRECGDLLRAKVKDNGKENECKVVLWRRGLVKCRRRSYKTMGKAISKGYISSENRGEGLDALLWNLKTFKDFVTSLTKCSAVQ